METESEYIEPTTASRLKIVAAAAALLATLEASRKWLFPQLAEHIKSLPTCEQIGWLIISLQAAFFVAALLISAVALPLAFRLLKYKQFPPPGAWVWRRQKIQRGKPVLLRAYATFILCALTFAPSFWVGQYLQKLSIHDECKNI